MRNGTDRITSTVSQGAVPRASLAVPYARAVTLSSGEGDVARFRARHDWLLVLSSPRQTHDEVTPAAFKLGQHADLARHIRRASAVHLEEDAKQDQRGKYAEGDG